MSIAIMRRARPGEDRYPAGIRSYARAAIEALKGNGGVKEKELFKDVCKAVHGKVPRKKAERNNKWRRFSRAMQRLEYDGTVVARHYGRAPRIKSYGLSSFAELEVRKAKIPQQYARALDI